MPQLPMWTGKFCQSETVAAVFDVRRAYFHAEVKRNTFVELPDRVPADQRASRVGKLRKALHGTRPAAASCGDELRKGLVGSGPSVAHVSRCCFCDHSDSVAGAVHSYDIFIAGPRERVLKIAALLKERWEARDQVIGPGPW